MSRRSKESTWLDVAGLMAGRSTCCRLQVGCVLVDARGQVLSTGYNGRASGLVHCNEISLTEYAGHTQISYPFRCQNSDAPSGQPNGCEAIHAEQNALLQCEDVQAIDACYCTHSPCLTCVKLLMNTGCQRILFRELYPHPEAERLWIQTPGRLWLHFTA